MVLTHTPLLALLEEWSLRVQLPLTVHFREAVVDDICLDVAALCIVKPLKDMRVAIFHLISGIEKLSGDHAVSQLLVGRFAASLIHTVLKRL